MMMIMIMIVMITMKSDNDEGHVDDDDVDEECHDVWYVISYDDRQDDEHDDSLN